MCAAASYGLALWTMPIAPIALAAGLRETSVILGTIFACRKPIIKLQRRHGKRFWDFGIWKSRKDIENSSGYARRSAGIEKKAE
jgi:hypothetical protein